MLEGAKLTPQHYTSGTDILPSVSNEAPAPRLGKNSDGFAWSALQVMTDLRLRRSLLRVMPGRLVDGDATKSIERTAAESATKIELLPAFLHDSHKEVAELRATRCKRATYLHNAATNITKSMLAVVDFVVVCKATCPYHKLLFRWWGLRKIAAVKSTLVYVFEIFSHAKGRRFLPIV